MKLTTGVKTSEFFRRLITQYNFASYLIIVVDLLTVKKRKHNLILQYNLKIQVIAILQSKLDEKNVQIV